MYGSLPPETRRAQAELFNTGVNQVLVATDAVGMGLNLQIGRVILNSMRKFDGRSSRELTVGETKQIVGRAGRFSSVFAEGKAAVRRLSDVPLLHHNMAQEVDTLPRAGLLPTYDIVKKVNKQHPGVWGPCFAINPCVCPFFCVMHGRLVAVGAICPLRGRQELRHEVCGEVLRGARSRS